jgi:hypothetical protein
MSSSAFHRTASAVVTALDVALLRVGWVSPSELMAHCEHPRRWVETVGTDAAALELARSGLWLAALWLALAVIAVLATGLPGTMGRIADAVAGRAVPTVLRRTIATALGASVVLVPVASGASTPAGHGGAMPPATAAIRAQASGSAAPLVPPVRSGTGATSLSGGWPWPTSASTTTRPSAPASAAVPAKSVPWPRSATPPASTNGTSSSDVVVGAGDCLWAIAAHRLGPQASAHRIATETRRWYSANAATIGPDPDLIQPGQHLHPPTEKGR